MQYLMLFLFGCGVITKRSPLTFSTSVICYMTELRFIFPALSNTEILGMFWVQLFGELLALLIYCI